MSALKWALNPTPAPPLPHPPCRYFAEVMLEAGCVDWCFLLAMLLLDHTLIGRVVAHSNGIQLDREVLARNLRGMQELRKWAELEW